MTGARILSFVAAHKLAIGLLGVLLIIMGWVIDKTAPGSWADHFFFPSYTRAVAGLAEMEKRRKALAPGAKGFDEIAAVLKRHVKGPTGFQIDRIEILEITNVVASGEKRAEVGAVWRVRVSVGAQSVEGSVNNLEDVLESEYRGGPKERWSAGVFWLGVVIQFVLLFV